jgi:hypothetical protein
MQERELMELSSLVSIDKEVKLRSKNDRMYYVIGFKLKFNEPATRIFPIIRLDPPKMK